jgi:hypothetical protein
MLVAEILIDEKQKIDNSQQPEKPPRSLAKALSWRVTGSPGVCRAKRLSLQSLAVE